MISKKIDEKNFNLLVKVKNANVLKESKVGDNFLLFTVPRPSRLVFSEN